MTLAVAARLDARASSGARRPSARAVDEVPSVLDALTLLRRDLPRGPLLTAEQERALARRMRGEDVRVPAPGDARPSPRQAHDRLVEENLRLVMSVARKYRGRGLPVEDLIQEGALALRRAAEGFDPDQGRLAPYAILWVREAIVRALTRDTRAIRVPARVTSSMGRVASTEEWLRTKLGRDPRPAEIGEELGLTAVQVEDLQRVSRRPTSLDAPGKDGEPVAEATLVDSGPPPETQAEARWMRGDVHRVLTALEPRQRQILTLRFGIDQERPHSSAEVGALLNISGRRAERMELQALTRLRAMQGMRDMLVYLR